MDSSGGPPPPDQGPWPGDARMAGLRETDPAGPCASQRPHGGPPLPAPVSYSTLGGAPQPVFQGVVPSAVSCSPPKPLEQPAIGQGAPMGPVPLQPEPNEGAPVPPWLLLPQRHPAQPQQQQQQPQQQQQQQQQHLYYEGQQVVQQPLHPQRAPVMQQGGGGPHSGEGPPAPVNMGELPPWQPPMDCSAERSVSFACTSPCIISTQAPPPYAVSPLPAGPFVGDLPHISTQQPHLQQWQPAAPAAAQNEALQPPPGPAAAAAAAAPPPPGAAVAPFPFGMCMGAPQGPPGGLKGGPEAPTSSGPWQPMQQQQQHQQQHQQQQQQQQRGPQQPPQQQHVNGLQPPGGVYPPLGLGGQALSKAENKSSRPPKGGGACRRKTEAAGEGGAPPAPPSGTRPAKFFKQHSPGKGAPKPRGKGSGAQGVAQEDGAPKDPSAGSVGCQGAPHGGPPSHGAPMRPPSMGGHCKPPATGFEKGEGNSGAPKPNPRPRAVRPSEVMAKMYFHRKKEAWRAELLIEGTKKQKSFSCRLYGYERARLMCEWARKFVLRTSRLPTDEETCTSLASLMKEPLPPQVPTALPYGRGEGAAAGAPQGAPAAASAGAAGGGPAGAPPGTQAPLSASGEASQGKGPGQQREQQPAAATAAPAGSAAAAAAAAAAGGSAVAGGTAAAAAGGVAAREEGSYGGDVGCIPSSKGPLEQRVSGGGVCKKRKDAAKCGEGNTKVRKGSDCPGGAPPKKGQAPRAGAPEASAEAARRVPRTELLGGPPNGKAPATGENRGEGPAPMISPYIPFKGVEASGGAYNGAGAPPPSGAPGGELPVAECSAPCLGGGPPRGGPPEEVAVKAPCELGYRGPEGCSGEGLSGGTNPWFEELEQLKKISRPKGGRAKRFNDEKDMKSQFELARSFLRQVIDKGRQLHDSDGEGLSEDEPAWLVRGTSSSKWACKKDAGSTICAKPEQQHRPKSPTSQQIRRRPPSLTNKGAPRPGLPGDAARGGPLMGSQGDCQAPCGVGPYFVHGGPPSMQGEGGHGLSRGPLTSTSGAAFAPKGPGEAPAGWVQRGGAGDGDVGELPEEEAGAGSQGGSKAEGPVPWGPSFSETGETDAAGGSRAPELPLQLQLPLMQCRGVFTTADSPMCGRPSPKERSPFSTDATTGFFSAVTTTADEALPLTSCNAAEGPPTAPGPCPSKTSGGIYAPSYFSCQPFVAPTEGRGGGPPTHTAPRAPEGAPMMPLSTNPQMQEAEVNLSHGEFAPPSHEGPSGGPLPPTLPYPIGGGPPPAAVPATLFQPADGTPRSPESFLQFRPFVEQPTAQLETSLGEELLSVAGYSCGFGFNADAALSSKQQMNQNSPLLPNRQPNGMMLLPGHDPAAGAPKGGAHFGPPGAPWALASPLTLHRPKDDNRTRNMPDKTEHMGQGGPGRARGEAVGHRPPATLPWVVVRPREDEEKALTPLAGRASGYMLQGPPMGCAYIPHHAN